MTDPVVNENSACWVTVAFTDRAGTAAAPTTITYTVHDGIDGTSLLSTSIAAAASVEIRIAGTRNAIRHGRRYEPRLLTVTSVDGSGNRQIDEFRWLVQNLGMVQSTST